MNYEDGSQDPLQELRSLLSNNFPRLFDLYTASDTNHPDNYFEHPNCLEAIKRSEEQLVAIESDLQQLDSKAWQGFKTKTAHLLTVNDKWGWKTQLFDCFDEASGYRFLKDQGYADIMFIPQRKGMRTPDLRATRQDGGILLEVKTIHESAEENDRLMRRGKYQDKDNLSAWNVNHFLNDAMRLKLQNTISSAAEQLNYTDENVQRQLLLFIRLDLTCATQQTLHDLDQFLANIHVKNVEVLHVVKNKLFL